MGDIKNPGLRILQVLNAVACICPPAFDGDILMERHARIADANRWLESQAKGKSNVTIMDVLLKGIESRITATIGE